MAAQIDTEAGHTGTHKPSERKRTHVVEAEALAAMEGQRRRLAGAAAALQEMAGKDDHLTCRRAKDMGELSRSDIQIAW